MSACLADFHWSVC